MLSTPQHLMIVRLMSWEVDELEACDFSLDEELNNKSDDVSDAALLKQLCFPYPPPNLSSVRANYFELTPWLRRSRRVVV